MADGTTPKRARRQSKDALEFYETPALATRAILPHLPYSREVLDPCAGRGAILAEVRRWDERCETTAIEIDPQHELALRGNGAGPVSGWLIEDAFSADALDEWHHADLVIMNPPFSLGQAFVEHALKVCRPGTTIAALLRLAFLEGKGRAQLHREHPSDVYVFAERPSFSGPRIGKRGKPIKGTTDAAALGWFVWGPGRGGRWSLLEEQGNG